MKEKSRAVDEEDAFSDDDLATAGLSMPNLHKHSSIAETRPSNNLMQLMQAPKRQPHNRLSGERMKEIEEAEDSSAKPSATTQPTSEEEPLAVTMIRSVDQGQRESSSGPQLARVLDNMRTQRRATLAPSTFNLLVAPSPR